MGSRQDHPFVWYSITYFFSKLYFWVIYVLFYLNGYQMQKLLSGYIMCIPASIYAAFANIASSDISLLQLII